MLIHLFKPDIAIAIQAHNPIPTANVVFCLFLHFVGLIHIVAGFVKSRIWLSRSWVRDLVHDRFFYLLTLDSEWDLVGVWAVEFLRVVGALHLFICFYLKSK